MRIGVPSLMVCPRCEGQLYDRGSCSLCGNCGYLTEETADRLSYAQQVQVLATFALATGIELAVSSEADPTAGLPPDLTQVLRDQSVIVPQDQAVFEQIAKWGNAPSNTASADLRREETS